MEVYNLTIKRQRNDFRPFPSDLSTLTREDLMPHFGGDVKAVISTSNGGSSTACARREGCKRSRSVGSGCQAGLGWLNCRLRLSPSTLGFVVLPAVILKPVANGIGTNAK